MSESGISRREFLGTSGHAAAGATVVAATGGTLLIGGSGAWAMQLSSIGADSGQILLRSIRLIYPHDSIGDQYYAGVVEALDVEAGENADVGTVLADGTKGLDGAFPVPFLELSEGHQLQALHAMEASDFFQKVRSKTVAVLYNNPGVWEAFGYQGSSFDEGGYIERGFDDLGWLPNPPEEASPSKA